MNGPEHYYEAERLIRAAYNPGNDEGDDALFVAEAQVHATLALAAATAQMFLLDQIASDVYSLGGIKADVVAWVAALAPDDAAAPPTPAQVARADEFADLLGVDSGEASGE